MRIAVVFRADYFEGKPVPAYPWSYVDAFREMGHEVEVLGEGLSVMPPPSHEECMSWAPFDTEGRRKARADQYDLGLLIENGRNEKGELNLLLPNWHCAYSAVLLYDTHGHPDLHAEISKQYDHVFFGSWVKRDLFAGHKSAHWCPSATDLKWFGTPEQLATEPTIDVGFFGSKRGLSRAHDLIEICKKNGWTYDVRQIASNRRVRWPATGNAMAKCRVLFNQGQKHDSPNLRCIESMAMGRPLLSNCDQHSGMGKLFQVGLDYFAYGGPGGIEEGLGELLKNEVFAYGLSASGHGKVATEHLVKHRAAQILEVVCNSSRP